MSNNKLLNHENYLLDRQGQLKKITRKISGNIQTKGLEKIKGLDKPYLIISANHWSLADPIISTQLFLNEKINLPFTVGGSNLQVKPFTKEFLGYSILPDLEKSGMVPIRRGEKIKTKSEDVKKTKTKLEEIIKEKNNVKLYDKGGRSKDGLVKNIEASLIKDLIHMVKDSNEDYQLIIETFNYDEIPEIEVALRTAKIKENKKQLYEFRALLSDFKGFYHHSKNGAATNEAHFIYSTPISIKKLIKMHKGDLEYVHADVMDRINEAQKETIITPTNLIASIAKKYESLLKEGEFIAPGKATEYLKEFFENNPDANYSTFLQEKKDTPKLWNEIINRGIFCLNKGYENKFIQKLGSGFRMADPQKTNVKHMASDRNQIVDYYANQIKHLTPEENPRKESDQFENIPFTEFQFYGH